MITTPEELPDERESTRVYLAPERKIFVWLLIIFGVNFVCLLLLAARANSPETLRGYFDVGIFACMTGVAILGIVRVMFLFPFRLLDLLVMVATLGFGMKGAIEIAHWVQRLQLRMFSEMPGPALMAEICILVGCIMTGGAAMGLRNCRTLNVESPIRRAIVLIFGMMALPAPIGLVTIPAYLASAFMSQPHTSISSLIWMVAMLFCALITVSNSLFSIRGMALKTENATQESAWRKP